jgi:hypothetical protein
LLFDLHESAISSHTFVAVGGSRDRTSAEQLVLDDWLYLSKSNGMAQVFLLFDDALNYSVLYGLLQIHF